MIDKMADAPLTFPTPKGGCHPLWVLGHLTVVEGILHQLLLGGENPAKQWEPLFGQETMPTADASAYPPFEEVRARYQEARNQTLRFLDTLTEADLDKETPWQPKGLESHFATFGKSFLTIALHQISHRGR